MMGIRFATLERLTEAAADERMAHVRKRHPELGAELLGMALDADPDKDAGHLPWIAARLADGSLRLPEDAEALTATLKQFDDLKRRKLLKGPKADLLRYTRLSEVQDAIDELMGAETKGERLRGAQTAGASIVYEQSPWKVIRISTPEAAAKLCRSSRWCVKDPKWAKMYLRGAPMFLVYRQDQPFALLHGNSGQAQTPDGKPISWSQSKALAPFIKRLGVRKFEKELLPVRVAAKRVEQEAEVKEPKEAVAWIFDHPQDEIPSRIWELAEQAPTAIYTTLISLMSDEQQPAPSAKNLERISGILSNEPVVSAQQKAGLVRLVFEVAKRTGRRMPGLEDMLSPEHFEIYAKLLLPGELDKLLEERLAHWRELGRPMEPDSDYTPGERVHGQRYIMGITALLTALIEMRDEELVDKYAHDIGHLPTVALRYAAHTGNRSPVVERRMAEMPFGKAFQYAPTAYISPAKWFTNYTRALQTPMPMGEEHIARMAFTAASEGPENLQRYVEELQYSGKPEDRKRFMDVVQKAHDAYAKKVESETPAHAHDWHKREAASKLKWANEVLQHSRVQLEAK